MEEELKKFEALEWLKNNKNLSALASNRFGKTVNAIKFVERLYKLGAVKVSVIGIWDEPERVEEEGGPYASSLLVELPQDIKKREEILKTYNKEIKEHDLNESNGEELKVWDKNILDFWWD
ncbi:hypothetical protein [Sinanaerobacter chloroacetimidivorans]|uniref:Uncharacterized protein n=1 Tax=Sinanaerobacter chloroacetimidivorans TaxID=2818044 RepID=A0A8J8B1Q7_9FIRM|nr:hypothetical protein [Sinanaerobacter chloroacetimidivorans]MBR0598494.1 hypothetical protein [Sinanaerobacter chloroacetimidivorans]